MSCGCKVFLRVTHCFQCEVPEQKTSRAKQGSFRALQCACLECTGTGSIGRLECPASTFPVFFQQLFSTHAGKYELTIIAQEKRRQQQIPSHFSINIGVWKTQLTRFLLWPAPCLVTYHLSREWCEVLNQASIGVSQTTVISMCRLTVSLSKHETSYFEFLIAHQALAVVAIQVRFLLSETHLYINSDTNEIQRMQVEFCLFVYY